MTIVSKGNTKIGRIPNVSLSPRVGCVDGIPCADKCYAMKAYRQYPNVRRAWDYNLYLAVNYRDDFFDGIAEYLHEHPNKYFRWHVAGDVLDEDYYLRMMDIADEFPDIRFRAFTKAHDILATWFETTPENLVMGASMWPGWGDLQTVKNIPKAWLQTEDHQEDRVPKKAFVCPGSCPECMVCWSKKQPMDIVLHEH